MLSQTIYLVRKPWTILPRVTRTLLLVFVLLMRLSTPALASHAVPGVISGVIIQYSRKSRWRLRWRLRKVLTVVPF